MEHYIFKKGDIVKRTAQYLLKWPGEEGRLWRIEEDQRTGFIPCTPIPSREWNDNCDLFAGWLELVDSE